MTDRRDYVVVALLALVVLMPVAGVVAQTLTHSATSGVTYATNSGVEVTLGDDRDVPAVPFADDSTFQDTNLTVSGSDAQVTVTDATYGSDPLSMQDVAVTGEVTVSRADLSRSITITDGDASVLQLRDYAVGDGQTDLAYSSSNGLTVRLTGFDSIGVAAVDAGTGEPLDTVNVDSSGIATFELPAGTRDVRFEGSPSELQVRNEAQPSELITENVTLTARLFTGGDTVIQRPVTNGTVSLDGVPLDEELVITVREENADYTYRRILVESAIETSEIYLLPTSEPSAEVRFRIQDETGRFDGDDTRLFVEKPITRDFDGDGTNETRYQVISGDRVGADAEFPTILVDSTRYRLRVENAAGEQRVLGSYVVQGARISALPIGEVQFSADVSEGAALQASIREAPDSASHNHELRFVYLDPEGSTDQIEISVTNSTGANIRPTTTEDLNGTTSAYVETYPLDTSFNPEEDTATVTVDAQQGLETVTYEQTVGDVPEILTNAPIDPQVLELLGLVSIVGVAGLLVIVRPAAAALVTPGWAGLLSLTGVVGIPMAGVVFAGVVGVLAVVGKGRR